MSGAGSSAALDRRDALACVLLVGLALAVRLVGVNGGLWLDEINGLMDWMRPSFGEILTDWKGDGQHPLYALLAHASLVILGEEAWTVRLPAVLFGVATIPLLYALARHAGSRLEAVLAATLLAVSYHHVWFSQNARGYTTLTFFVLLATYCLVRALTDWRTRWFAGWGVAIALGAYTHLTVAFPAIAHVLVMLTVLLAGRTRPEARARWRPAAIGAAIALGATLLLYAPILGEVVWWFLYRPSNFEGISTPSWALAEAVRVLRQGIAGVAGALIGVIALAAGGAVMLAGAASFARQSRTVLALFTLPAILTFAGTLIVRGTMYPRFFFYVLPFLVLIAVRGALRLPHLLLARQRDPGPWPLRPGTALAALMIVASAFSLPYNYRHPKQDFGGALAWVDAHRQPGEAVVLVGATVGPYQRFYGRDWAEVSSVAELERAGHGEAGYWLLYTFTRFIEVRTPDLMAKIRESCAEPAVFPGTVGGGDISVCRVTKGAGPS